MTLHIHRARAQPATRYRIALLDNMSITIRHRRRCQLYADCCRSKRIAANLTVQVYYDMLRFSCRSGTGCKRPKTRRRR